MNGEKMSSHLNVYHLIARSRYGLMVQMLAGLITYILLAIYCYSEFGEKVSIRRVRELRIKIINETRAMGKMGQHCSDCNNQHNLHLLRTFPLTHKS